MRLRTILFASMFMLLAAIITVVVTGVIVILGREADTSVHAALQRGKQSFEELQTLRQALLRSQVRVISEEPRLKAVVSTQDIDHETVLGVAQEIRQAVQADLFIITNAAGTLLADVADTEATGFDMSQNPLVAEALAKGTSLGVLVDGNDVYEAQGRRLAFGATTVGVMIVGYRLDDKKAEAAAQNSGATIAIAIDGKVFATSLTEDGATLDKQDMSAVLDPAFGSPDQLFNLRYHGNSYLVTAHAYPNYQGHERLQYAVLRSRERALAATWRLRDLLLLLLAGGGLLVGGAAVIVARGLSRPIDKLLLFTKIVSEGDLRRRADVVGPRELQELAISVNAMLDEIEKSRAAQGKQHRLEQEIEIARRLQTALLPRELRAPGLDISAVTKPATEVGGDYCDLLPLDDGAWIAIGDVAGHGLTSGMIMLMVHCMVNAITRADSDLMPKDVMRLLNSIVFDTIRNRLGQEEHVTLTLLKYDEDGSFVFAGAHEDLLVWRAKTGKCEVTPTPGTWVGAMPDIDRFTVNSVVTLEPGDLMVLFTDGVIEALNDTQQQFGIERVAQIVESNAKRTPLVIRDAIYEAVQKWWARQSDDVSIIVMRYKGTGDTSA